MKQRYAIGALGLGALLHMSVIRVMLPLSSQWITLSDGFHWLGPNGWLLLVSSFLGFIVLGLWASDGGILAGFCYTTFISILVGIAAGLVEGFFETSLFEKMTTTAIGITGAYFLAGTLNPRWIENEIIWGGIAVVISLIGGRMGCMETLLELSILCIFCWAVAYFIREQLEEIDSFEDGLLLGSQLYAEALAVLGKTIKVIGHFN